MGWIAQKYEGEVHVVPDHDPELGHVLAAECECQPIRDPEGDPMWVHRDVADRIAGNVPAERFTWRPGDVTSGGPDA